MKVIECQEELIKRYSYLYNNKEFILAMCIRYKKDIKYYKQKLKDDKYCLKIMKRLKHNSQADVDYCKKMIAYMESEIIHDNEMKDAQEPYLCADVDNDIISTYERFLFTDKNMEDTVLYKHIEMIKNEKVMHDGICAMIADVDKRRKRNLILRNMPTFTVWKILTYVRNKNLDNGLVLNALDKYYNLDRYMLTHHNWESGYGLTTSEYFMDCELEAFPKGYITAGDCHSMIISRYQKNGIEAEDEFCDYDKVIPIDNVTDNFISTLACMSMLSENVKEDLYKKLEHPYTKMFTM